MKSIIMSLTMIFVTALTLTWFKLEQFRLGYEVAQSMHDFRRTEDSYRLQLVTYAKRTGLPILKTLAQIDNDMVQPATQQIIELRTSF